MDHRVGPTLPGAAAAVLMTILAGCGGAPLPADKAEYAGSWKGGGIDLLITADGGCKYSRVSSDGSVNVNAPIQKFEGDDFVVGVAMMTTTFDVTAPPHEDAGKWKMTVDGVELERVAK